MKRAAFGIRMHSGWGVLVAVSEDIEVIDRRRIVVTKDVGPRSNQPFHHAEELGLPKAEAFLAKYRSESERLAREAIETAIKDAKVHGYRIAAAALLLASGRPLPGLPQILASHPLIHTAEGELFREVVSSACIANRITVARYRERDLEDLAKAALAENTKQRLANAGRILGPPWTADHKAAALAACITLQERTTGRKSVGA
jgi:hypothetical protein